MKYEDLKVGQVVTLYKYHLDLDNNIKVERLDYYYVHEIKTEFKYKNFGEIPTNRYTNTIITFYDKREDYNFIIPWNKVEINIDNGYEFKENGLVLYSLYNDGITLKAFINLSILALNHQTEHYKTQYEIMYKEYQERLKKMDKLKKDKSE